MRLSKVAVVPLLLLSACSATASVTGERVVISIEHSRFIPSQITAEAGRTITFVVRNDDPIAHELIIGDARVQQRHENGTERHHGARPGEISIPAGATRTTTYTFAGARTLLIGCHLPGHYDYGMRGEITVLE